MKRAFFLTTCCVGGALMSAPVTASPYSFAITGTQTIRFVLESSPHPHGFGPGQLLHPRRRVRDAQRHAGTVRPRVRQRVLRLQHRGISGRCAALPPVDRHATLHRERVCAQLQAGQLQPFDRRHAGYFGNPGTGWLGDAAGGFRRAGACHAPPPADQGAGARQPLNARPLRHDRRRSSAHRRLTCDQAVPTPGCPTSASHFSAAAAALPRGAACRSGGAACIIRCADNVRRTRKLSSINHIHPTLRQHHASSL